jgi:hypothetical protein
MREPGYYWVKYKGKWMIANWDDQYPEPGESGYWNLVQTITDVNDNSFDEIDERRIVRDEPVTFFSLESHLIKRIEQFAHDTIELYKQAEKG